MKHFLKQNIIFKPLVLVFFILTSLYLNAQDIEISGRLKAFGEIPVENFPVRAKKSGTVTLTDSSGYYSIVCEEKDVLLFKEKPFRPERVRIRSNDSVNINLIYVDGRKSKERIIKNGFMSESELAYAIDNLSHQNNDLYSYTNIYDLLENRFSDVIIEGKTIYIRGQAQSFTLSTAALLIVNGLEQNDISSVQPVNVESVRILKGTEAAIYGSRGSSGVIEITLK